MASPAFHRFGPHGPVCGTHDGVNAADMDPPEITCRRCKRAPVYTWGKTQTIRRDGRLFVCSQDEAYQPGGSLYVRPAAIWADP